MRSTVRAGRRGAAALVLLVAVTTLTAGCAAAPAGSSGAPDPGRSGSTPSGQPGQAGQPGPGQPTTASGAPTATAPPPTSAPAPGSTPAGGDLRLVVEPDDGIAPIDALLSSPQHTLDMELYELVDPTAEADLVADAARGVRVRVVLDRQREGAANTPAYDDLASHGVEVAWAPATYEATHSKAFVIDAGYSDQQLVVMTLNLTSRYYATTRDVAVVDPSSADVTAAESVFGDDLSGVAPAPEPTGADLVWSPGSTAALVELIDGATRTVALESEEMDDPEVEAALEAAAARGVRVEVTLTTGEDTTELAQLSAAGVSVTTLPDTPSVLYIHAKVIVVDAGGPSARAFVGSENISGASLERNRELGLVVTGPAVVARLAAIVATDHGG